MVEQEETYEAIVVGGGPGGSTAATFVAMHGHRVLLLERERFPRYQIGESLLPATVNGICRMLGVADEVHKAGFVPKVGGTFRWGKRPEPWTFSFDQGIPALRELNVPVAYQVERAKFDSILLENARRKGVTVIEQAEVDDLLSDGACVTGVRFTDQDGTKRQARARIVVDASGNQSRLHQYAGERVYSEFFKNVAVFGYFKGGKRLPPPNSGNILSAAFSKGWFWYIPLSEELTSVGVVIGRQHAGLLKSDFEAVLREMIEECPVIREMLSSATRVVDGMYGKIRVRKDYSYTNTKFWTPGLVLVGDAACFIDPVFSSGVHLATYSALLAARSINTILRGAIEERRCFEEYERRYRAEFQSFYDFLLAFYDMNQDEESYFWTARKVLNSSERDNIPFIRLVAGGGTASNEFFRIRGTLGQVFERHVENMTEGRSYTDETTFDPLWDAAGDYPLETFFRHARTHAGILLESFGTPPEDDRGGLPFGIGLVPSADRLHWTYRHAASKQGE